MTDDRDDDQFLRTFEERTLPFREWTHRAHLRVAWLFLSRLPYGVALDRMRSGIQAYNAAHRVPEGPERGYHETTTVAFMRLIHARLIPGATATSFDAFCSAHPDLLDKRVLLQFYSRERIMSADAKRTFVDPDLCPLPVVGTT
jgi:hypothetical protein